LLTSPWKSGKSTLLAVLLGPGFRAREPLVSRKR
jgi:hypothetical protein